jgi:hypothetical protein
MSKKLSQPRARTRSLHGRALGILVALVGFAGCGDEETALVLEVQSALAPAALDTVTFRVAGPGLEAGGRTAEVPLVGPSAKQFPLRLALIHGGAAMGPLAAIIEGRLGGEMRAKVSDAPPLYFVPGRTTTHRFVLQALAPAPAVTPPADAMAPATNVPATATPPSTAPDAGTPSPPPSDAGAPPAAPSPTTTPTPPPGVGGMAGSSMNPPGNGNQGNGDDDDDDDEQGKGGDKGKGDDQGKGDDKGKGDKGKGDDNGKGKGNDKGKGGDKGNGKD